jgi:fumarate hydratase class II
MALGGTAVGTGINAAPGLPNRRGQDRQANQAAFVSAPNKFTVQGARAWSSSPARSAHWRSRSTDRQRHKADVVRAAPASPSRDPGEQPGSSIMPGKVNPTQARR